MTVSIVSLDLARSRPRGVLFAGCALLARGGTIDRLSMWYLGFGLTGSELPALLATLGVVLAAAAWALGADAHAAGRVAMVLHVLAVAGLLWALWRARGTFSVIDGTLRQAFGPTTSRASRPRARALLQRKLSPKMWWKPFSYARAMSNGSATCPTSKPPIDSSTWTCSCRAPRQSDPGRFC